MSEYIEEVNAKISKMETKKKKKTKKEEGKNCNRTYSTQNDEVKKIDVENNFFELGKKELPYPTKKKHEWSEIKILYKYKYFKNRRINDKIEIKDLKM